MIHSRRDIVQRRKILADNCRATHQTDNNQLQQTSSFDAKKSLQTHDAPIC